MAAFRWFRIVVTEHYADFNGRAGRAEFWWYVVAFTIIEIVLMVVQHLLHTNILVPLFGLGLFAPSLALQVRRLHDIGKSGSWLFIVFIPAIGGLVLSYWFFEPSTPGPNEFGPEPKA